MTEAARTAFEKWAIPVGFDNVTKTESGKYTWPTISYAWTAWQASRQALVDEAVAEIQNLKIPLALPPHYLGGAGRALNAKLDRAIAILERLANDANR